MSLQARWITITFFDSRTKLCALNASGIPFLKKFKEEIKTKDFQDAFKLKDAVAVEGACSLLVKPGSSGSLPPSSRSHASFLSSIWLINYVFYLSFSKPLLPVTNAWELFSFFCLLHNNSTCSLKLMKRIAMLLIFFLVPFCLGCLKERQKVLESTHERGKLSA